ncbi:MAG: substrate-binding domain-containing protein, partial [Anaerolineae bacterium]
MRRILVSFILVLMLVLAACSPSTTVAPTAEPGNEDPTQEPSTDEETTSISVAGSTTVQPLAQLFAEAFMEQNPNVSIDIQGGGSSVGVKSAGQNVTDVGMASREIKDSELEEYPDLKIYVIARDGIAIAT